MITHVHGLHIGDVVMFDGLAREIVGFPTIHLIKLEPMDGQGGVVTITELERERRKAVNP